MMKNNYFPEPWWLKAEKREEKGRIKKNDPGNTVSGVPWSRGSGGSQGQTPLPSVTAGPGHLAPGPGRPRTLGSGSQTLYGSQILRLLCFAITWEALKSLMSGLIPRNFNATGLGCAACTSGERVPKVQVSTEAKNHHLVMYTGLLLPRAAIRKHHKLGCSQ